MQISICNDCASTAEKRCRSSFLKCVLSWDHVVFTGWCIASEFVVDLIVFCVFFIKLWSHSFLFSGLFFCISHPRLLRVIWQSFEYFKKKKNLIIYQRFLLCFFFPKVLLQSLIICFVIWHVNIQQFEVNAVHVPLSPREPSPALGENKGSYRNCWREFF